MRAVRGPLRPDDLRRIVVVAAQRCHGDHVLLELRFRGECSRPTRALVAVVAGGTDQQEVGPLLLRDGDGGPDRGLQTVRRLVVGGHQTEREVDDLGTLRCGADDRPPDLDLVPDALRVERPPHVEADAGCDLLHDARREGAVTGPEIEVVVQRDDVEQVEVVAAGKSGQPPVRPHLRAHPGVDDHDVGPRVALRRAHELQSSPSARTGSGPPTALRTAPISVM